MVTLQIRIMLLSVYVEILVVVAHVNALGYACEISNITLPYPISQLIFNPYMSGILIFTRTSQRC